MQVVALYKFVLLVYGEVEGLKLFEVDNSLVSAKFERVEIFILEGGVVFGEIDAEEESEVVVEVSFSSDSDKTNLKKILKFHLLTQLITFSCFNQTQHNPNKISSKSSLESHCIHKFLIVDLSVIVFVTFLYDFVYILSC